MKFSNVFCGTGREYSAFEKQIPAPCFRREFDLENVQSLQTVEFTICGLGLYELYINGRNVTRGMLSSYFANPDDILYYDHYDLKPYLQEGRNVIGVILGNGWLNAFGGVEWDFHKARFRSAPKFALWFEAQRGGVAAVSFDASGFKWAPSPIICDDLRCGEWYDARLEGNMVKADSAGTKQESWTTPGFDDSGWRPVVLMEAPRGEARLCQAPPILPTAEIKPVSVRKSRISILPNLTKRYTRVPMPEDEKESRGYLYDFGVNAAGLCRMTIHNTKPGQKIILQFGEILGDMAENGDTVRSGECGLDLRGIHFLPHRFNNRDIYICRGAEAESWMPRFTYHGFRYCLVIGLDKEQAVPELLTYVVMNSAMEKRAEFRCSDETVNKLWDAGIVSDCANMYHIPTDCPHREKNGWTGDAALSAEQMLTVLSAEYNLREWLHGVRKAMLENGQIPGIVPTAGWGYDEPFEGTVGPAWDAALVEIPYCIWKYRGDTEVLKENTAAILRYLHYIDSRRSKRGLLEYGLGDWCQAARRSVDHPKASNTFTSTVIAIDICRKASKIFQALGMKRQEDFAESLAEEFRAAVRKYLLDFNTMSAHDRCQTAQAMAIYYNVFDAAEKQQAFEVLLQLITENDGHFDCGILGMRVLFHVLSGFGQTELAYRMITREDFPSYGYWIKNGATALFELFAPIEKGQSSCNHHFFGDILSWFMKNLAGICLNPYGEDINQVRIAPRFVTPLHFVTASMEAPAGKISVDWKREGESIILSVTIPPRMDAELVLENGWQLEDGLTCKKVSGQENLRIISTKIPVSEARVQR